MFKNFAKIAIRDLIKHKTHTAINLIGLAVAVAICLLIFLFVQDELSYDEFHSFKERVYKLIALEPRPGDSPRAFETMPIPLGPVYQRAMPGVEAQSRWVRARVVVQSGDEPAGDIIAYVDSTFLDILTFPLLYGDSTTALYDPDAVVITRKTALAYFGKEDALGETMTYDVAGEKRDAVVSGVTADVPHNSTIQFTILQRIEAYPWWERYHDYWNSWRCITIVKLAPGTDPSKLEAAGSSFIYTNIPEEADRMETPTDSTRLLLQPVNDMRLNLAGRWEGRSDGSIENSYILGGIALLVLLVACLNYIILALGVSAGRVREVGMRKVLGAAPAQLARQFIIEAVVLVILAVTMGVALAELSLPIFNDLTDKTLSSAFSNGWILIGITALFTVVIGLVAGSAPAAILSRMRPINALKGDFRIGTLSRVGWLLVAVQFALTIFLIFGAVTISRQMTYLNSADLGYNKKDVIVIPTNASAPGEGERTLGLFRTALEGKPGVIHVSGTAMAFTEGLNMERWSREREDLWAFVYRVDPDYVKTMGMTIVAGRDFDPSRPGDKTSAVLVNQTAVKQFGLTAGAGEILPEYRLSAVSAAGGIADQARDMSNATEEVADAPPVTIVGVVKDHNFRSLKYTVEPMIIHVNPQEWLQYILVRVAPDDIPSTMSQLQSTWRSTFPDLPYKPEFLDDMLVTQYDGERRWEQVTLIASIIAIIIACMGLFGQVTLTIARRTKEIGIRKVLGASVSNVAVLLSGRLLLRILISGIISSGVAYYVMSRWLEQFPYRIDLGIESFVIAIGLALVIALTTAGVRTVRAATANPTESLRYE